MKTVPLNDETEAVARRLMWFESAAEALSDSVRLLAYAFARAMHEEMKALRAYLDGGRSSRSARPRSAGNH
ncbi:MAG TPA: hypothetical protein VKS78_17005 [Roseiarcus sp.]|nr:hypothetical protein [Roseiarcus sp.]